MRQWIGSALLGSAMLAYCQLDSWQHISVKFDLEFDHFHSRKFIWKCLLPKWLPFCLGGRWVTTFLECIYLLSLDTLTPCKHWGEVQKPFEMTKSDAATHANFASHTSGFPVKTILQVVCKYVNGWYKCAIWLPISDIIFLGRGGRSVKSNFVNLLWSRCMWLNFS